MLEIQTSDKRPASQEVFKCSLFQHSVNVVCGLQDCGYLVSNAPFSGNCLIQHLKTLGKNVTNSDLSLEEVATLEGVSVSQVRKVQRSALRQLASNVVQTAVDDGELKPNIYYIPNLPVCIVCESRVVSGSGGSEVTLFDDNCYFYCSPCCMKQHPVFSLESEVRFGVDFGSLLKWVVANFGSLGSAEKALNLTRVQMYEAASKFLGTNLESHFESLRGLKERRSNFLVKRTWHYPRIYSERAKYMRANVLMKAQARYGISEIEVEGILIGVESLVGPDKAKTKSKKSPGRTK